MREWRCRRRIPVGDGSGGKRLLFTEMCRSVGKRTPESKNATDIVTLSSLSVLAVLRHGGKERGEVFKQFQVLPACCCCSSERASARAILIAIYRSMPHQTLCGSFLLSVSLSDFLLLPKCHIVWSETRAEGEQTHIETETHTALRQRIKSCRVYK